MVLTTQTAAGTTETESAGTTESESAGTTEALPFLKPSTVGKEFIYFVVLRTYTSVLSVYP